MNIVKDCAAAIAVASENISCIEDIIKYISHIIIGKNGTSPACANGEYATATEMQAYLTAGNGYIMPVTNAIKDAPALTEFSGADTYEGNTITAQQTESLTVTFRKVTNEFRVMARANNLNNSNGLLWFVAKMDTGNYIIIGGTAGFKTNTFIPEFQHAGYGTQGQFIQKTYSWETRQAVIDLFSGEDNYNTLTNIVTVGTYTYVTETGTSQSSFDVDSFADVTGWNKTTYDRLYAKVTASTVVTFYGSSANRTAGTGAIGVIDISVGEAITGTLLGGSLDLIKSGLTLSDLFTVVYSSY